MKELIEQLSAISDAYDDFIIGVINYAKRHPSHVDILNDYMRGRTDLKSSDIIRFIMEQPDFHNYSAVNQMQYVG